VKSRVSATRNAPVWARFLPLEHMTPPDPCGAEALHLHLCASEPPREPTKIPFCANVCTAINSIGRGKLGAQGSEGCHAGIVLCRQGMTAPQQLAQERLAW